VATLSERLWRNEGRGIGSIRAGHVEFVARCESRTHCGRYARIRVKKCLDRGRPFCNRDYCDFRGRALLKKAELRRIQVYRS
jgi:hypothetical protein